MAIKYNPYNWVIRPSNICRHSITEEEIRKIVREECKKILEESNGKH